MAKVSVIMPMYNAQEYIHEAIASVLNQSLVDFELICVDDGSNDDTISIVNQYMLSDNRVKLIRQEHQYAGVARNKGIDAATGEYCVFWDSDDIFDINALELMYEACEKNNADICLCNADVLDNEKNVRRRSDKYLKVKNLPQKDVFNKNDIPDLIFDITVHVPWNKMYSLEFIRNKSLQFQDIKKHNDTFFVMTALYEADRITVVNKPLIIYRMYNQSSITGSIYDYQHAYQSNLKVLEYLERHDDYTKYKKSFLNRVAGDFMFTIDNQRDFNSYLETFTFFKNTGIHRFNLLAQEPSDFSPERKYYWISAIVNVEPEEYLVRRLREKMVIYERAIADKNRLRERLVATKERLEATKSKVTKLKERNEKLTTQLNAIKDSNSFKVGKAITSPLRAIKKTIN